MTLRARARSLAVRLLGINELPLANPWDYVQGLVEQKLHEYLAVDAGDIAAIVIVGAWRGHEIARLLTRYPACRIVCYEPLEEEYDRLVERYGNEPRVQCVMAAVSDQPHGSTARFYVPDVPGTGSLLKPVEGGRTPSKTTTDVRTVRLDDEPNIAELERIDCLWVDTQGAELQVLRSAQDVLARTQAVLAEVAAGPVPYVGGVRFAELEAELTRAGFGLVALGLDPRNGEGNALWSRRPRGLGEVERPTGQETPVPTIEQ